ncbi:MAG: hypothetical protein L0Z50_40655 [Verrucomicrobiales bacterium]|nr:hypothetical protein [Verrucomicrobiales bacterium]
MKNNESGKDDEALRALLKAWQPDAVLPPRFQETVWRRIKRAEQTPMPAAVSVWDRIANWIEMLSPRPSLALSCLGLLLAIGMTAGWAQARHETARVGDELGARYVQSVDPYQVTH